MDFSWSTITFQAVFSDIFFYFLICRLMEIIVEKTTPNIFTAYIKFYELNKKIRKNIKIIGKNIIKKIKNKKRI